ncbi:MAG: esterase, partial [Pseudomonadota bacterium]
MTAYPPQYQQLIDPQTRAFIERTDRWYPPDTIDFSITRQRDTYNAMCREFFHGYPAGVTSQDDHIAGKDCNVPVRH